MKKFFLRLLRLAVWIIIIILVLVLFLAGPGFYLIPKHWPSESNAELDLIRAELLLAESRWLEHNIVNYEIDVIGIVHPGGCGDFSSGSIMPWHLTVIQGEITFSDEIQMNSIELCNIDAFLPPRVFDTLRHELETADPNHEYLRVEFDTDYGFLTSYFLTANNRYSDLNVQITFSNFIPQP